MPNRKAGVLIVDDETDVCWALTHLLKKRGITSVSAKGGEEALALAEEYRFQLVFVDAKLPDLDGIELAHRLWDANPHVPIFLISGYFHRDDAEVHRALAAGIISGFISKPFLHDEVLSTAMGVLA